ncbi:MAG: dimethyl sulfoxide reductase anchor subunit family protein [Endozoicomonas sp.]
MNEYQLSLVFFTVLTQWSIGSVFAVTLYRSLSTSAQLFGLWNPREVAACIWLVCFIGSLCSLGHMGNPANAIYALRGLGHSWLSREVLAFLVLNSFMSLWMLSHFVEIKQSIQQLLGAATAITGFIAILVSAQIYYQLTHHTEWNTALTHFAFVSTALVLGLATLIVFLTASELSIPALIRNLLGLSVLMSFIVLLLLSQVTGAAGSSHLIWYQVFGTVLVGLMLFMMASTVKDHYPGAILIAMLVMVSGEVVGRMSFYSSVMSKVPW